MKHDANMATATTKHGVLGLLRGLHPNLHPNLPVRINAIAPSWTDTGIVPREILAILGEGNYQSADVVGRSVTFLMTDEKRHGELIYIDRGEFRDLENGEKGYQELTKKMVGMQQGDEWSELTIFEKLAKMEELSKANQ